ncbi:uncharacterized protein LOC124182960 [Neodiprion fabricii]|uniref:uncharacterized protein LOC124182960 n=1 Tax=Neodiprion fabricii TaxID=2872261 RepID=UPI001ED97F02|nr:uncharacterized protein LOC124182960 [Neodiprion fabricii]
MMLWMVLVLVVASRVSWTPANAQCSQISFRKDPVYALTKRCTRSTATPISRRNLEDLKSCKEFAVSKKALAFNFRPKKYASNITISDNCIALECPMELHPQSTSFVKDSRFEYYSAYGGNVAYGHGIKASCLPTLGVFRLADTPSNYSTAREKCAAWGGKLAHVVSAVRTDLLATLMTGNISRAFVGLSSQGKERLWKNEFDELLDCFDFRGWAQREPHSRRGCVALGKDRAWRVVSCYASLPSLCEILPSASPQKLSPSIACGSLSGTGSMRKQVGQSVRNDTAHK